MRNRLPTLFFALSVLVGCAGPHKPNLEVACALKKCTCISEGGGYFERNFKGQRQLTTAVLWTERGNAYCPEGYTLQLVDEKQKKQYYTPRSQREPSEDDDAGQ